MVHCRVLQPVLLATTVFCVSAALMMTMVGVAAAQRAPDSCVNEQRFVRAICELPFAYWIGCAVCIGKDELAVYDARRTKLLGHSSFARS